jgi:hypothetical protein
MFNLLCVRSAAIPRLTRLLQNTSLETQDQLDLSDQLEHEQTKSQRGKVENTLRQHNLLPVVFQLFKAMGESGQMGQSFSLGTLRWLLICRLCCGRGKNKRQREEGTRQKDWRGRGVG